MYGDNINTIEDINIQQQGITSTFIVWNARMIQRHLHTTQRALLRFILKHRYLSPRMNINFKVCATRKTYICACVIFFLEALINTTDFANLLHCFIVVPLEVIASSKAWCEGWTGRRPQAREKLDYEYLCLLFLIFLLFFFFSYSLWLEKYGKGGLRDGSITFWSVGG